MQEMIDAIRAALTEGATADQKTSGVHACRTIATALEAQVGKPITLPGAPTPGPLAGISSEQALDLLIARLRVVAADKDTKEATTAPAIARAPAPAGLRIPFVQPPPRTTAGAPRPPGPGSPAGRQVVRKRP